MTDRVSPGDGTSKCAKNYANVVVTVTSSKGGA